MENIFFNLKSITKCLAAAIILLGVDTVAQTTEITQVGTNIITIPQGVIKVKAEALGAGGA